MLKLTLYLGPQQEIMREVFPCMKLFYNLRHPKRSFMSYIHTLLSPVHTPFMRHMYDEVWYDSYPYDYRSPRLQALLTKIKTEGRGKPLMERFASDCAYLYGGCVEWYLRHKDIYLRCVLYEDLVGDPEEETTRLFDALEIPRYLVPVALTALRGHSQGMLFGDPKVVKRREWTEKDYKDMDRAFEDMGLPLRVDMPMDEFKALFN